MRMRLYEDPEIFSCIAQKLRPVEPIDTGPKITMGTRGDDYSDYSDYSGEKSTFRYCVRLRVGEHLILGGG